jgi:hypothetical protein
MPCRHHRRRNRPRQQNRNPIRLQRQRSPKQYLPIPLKPGLPRPLPRRRLTASQMKEPKPKLPIGVYIIAGFTLLGFVSGFFDTSNMGALFTILIFIDLALAVGLVFRLELARKALIWLSAITIALSLLAIVGLAGLQSKLAQNKAAYDTAVSKIDKSKITPQQQKTLDDLQVQINAQQKKAGKAIGLAYARMGYEIVVSGAVVFYLTRWHVKEVFQPLK